MNTKLLSFIIIALSLFVSCDNSPYIVHNLLEFRNCRATKMWVVAGCMCRMELSDETFYGFDNLRNYNEDENLETTAREYLMVLFTTEMTDTSYYPESAVFPAFFMRDSIMRDSNFVEQSIVFVEKQLAQSYRLDEEQSQSNKDGLYMVRIEYRTNGIEGLTITSTSKLWGEEPGNNLNKYFYIDYYDPNAIVEFDSHQLIYSFTDRDKMPKSIDEYISLKPLAPPSIRLMFNETPPELPCNVQFFVEMTTTDGYVLTDSTQIVHITKNE